MAHDSEAVVFHRVGDTARLQPFVYLTLRNRVVFQHSGDLKEGGMATAKYICDLRHGTSLAVSQPFTGHFRSVTHAVE